MRISDSGADRGKADGSVAGSPESSIFPCSYTQQRIWYSQQLDPTSSHWNVAMRWRLTGRVRDAAVERAWQILVERHEALRTTIEDVDGVPHQRVWTSWPAKLDIVDLSRLPVAQRTEAAHSIARNDALKLVPTTGQPPFRIQLLRLDEETALLLTNFHNIIVDGWSVGVLLREFGTIVAALEANQDPPLPDPSMQHVDYTLWQADMLATDSFAADKAYWSKLLANWSRFEVPTDRPRPPVLTHNGDIRTLVLSRKSSDALDQYAKTSGCSIFHIGTAMLSATLSNVTEITDVFLGTQAACRDEPELEGMVGPLINTIALRFDLSSDPTLKQVLLNARKRCTEGLTHQHLPFNFVVEALRPKRDASRNLIYSITCMVQAAHIDTGNTGDLNFDGLTIAAMPSFSAGAPTDLGFFLVGREEGWRLSCAGNTDMYDISTIDRLISRWAMAIENLIENDGRLRLGELKALPTRSYSIMSVGEGRDEVAKLEKVPDHPEDRTAKVAAIWKDLLGLETIEPDTDFFEDGGTSLGALRMIARVNEAVGHKLTLTSLIRASRFQDFVGLLDSGSPQQPVVGEARPPNVAPERGSHEDEQLIVALNRGGAYGQIERYLGPGYKIVDAEIGSPEDVAFATGRPYLEIVSRAVERIRGVQPHGPYVIMAYCGIGWLSCEVAKQLEGQGEQIKLLVMINATSPYYLQDLNPKARRTRKIAMLRETAANFLELLGMWRRRQISLAILLDHYGILRRLGLPRLVRGFSSAQPAPAEIEYEASLVFPKLLRSAIDAAPRMDGCINSDILVYRTIDYVTGPEFPPALGWMEWSRGVVRLQDIDAKHWEALRQQAASQIGPHLASYLSKSKAKESTGTANHG